MEFRVAANVFELFPDYCVGGVIAYDLDNSRAGEEAYRLLQTVMAEVRAKFTPANEGDNPVTAHPYISAWREAFRHAGIKPGEYLTSVEALLRRVAKGQDLPSISPAVDLANAVSLKYLLPMGGHDLDQLIGGFGVRLAHQGDFFSPPEGGSGEVENVPPGEPVYADHREVRTRRWVWRQGRKARVTSHSKSIFFPIDGFASINGAEVKQGAEELSQLLMEHLGAVCQTFYIDKTQPYIHWETKHERGTSMASPTVITGVKRERDKIDEILTRGVAEIVSREELEAKLKSGKQLRVKLGIDPTGPLVHIGRTVPLQKLRQFQDLGHLVTLVIGGFTAQIGDASDKTDTRPMLTPEKVTENMTNYKQQLEKFLDLSLVEWFDNRDWWNNMSFQQGIVLMSKFTVAQMIERDNFRERWEAKKPITLQELVYPILQGYDSVMMKTDVELGGTDQLFNMLAGRRLQELNDQPPQTVLCTELINGPDGRKMSTSQGNTVWIREESKNQYAQLMRTVDELIFKYFEVLTRVPMEEVEQMQERMANGENPMTFKKKLAQTLVGIYHSPEEAEVAQKEFEQVHQKGLLPDEIATFTPPDGATEMVLQELLVKTGLCTSNKEAQRIVEQGGITLNGAKAVAAKERVTLTDGMIVKRGNRQFVQIKL
jgi:tyrosyl-tRNA synthetase